MVALRARSSAAHLPSPQAAVVEIRAWQRFLAESEALPASVLAGLRDRDANTRWPEELLLTIAQRGDAPEDAIRYLLEQARLGSSLRWLDEQLPTLIDADLFAGESNPAIAGSVWREFSRRAIEGDQSAIAHLRRTIQSRPDTPGLADGLAHWPDALAAMENTDFGKSQTTALRKLRIKVWQRQMAMGADQ